MLKWCFPLSKSLDPPLIIRLKLTGMDNLNLLSLLFSIFFCFLTAKMNFWSLVKTSVFLSLVAHLLLPDIPWRSKIIFGFSLQYIHFHFLLKTSANHRLKPLRKPEEPPLFCRNKRQETGGNVLEARVHPGHLVHHLLLHTECFSLLVSGKTLFI